MESGNLYADGKEKVILMKICHIAAELAPLAKVGGLADVVYGLARETQRLGHPTSVIIPKYDILLTEEIESFDCLTKKYIVEFQGKKCSSSIWTGIVGGLRVYFLESHEAPYYFSRGCIYGCEDDVERFLYFSKAAWEFTKEKIRPDVIHLHDWQTAIIAVLSHEEKQNQKNLTPPLLLTLHNVDYQGRCAPSELCKIGLDIHKYYTPDAMQDSLYPEALNLLRGGIVYAGFITTVSPTYSIEIQASQLGEGLQSLIVQNRHKFSGILNGIDYDYWNPETDKYLPAHYGPIEQANGVKKSATLDSKGYVKKVLREHMNLEAVHRPIVGAICRLVPQKGVELIKHAMESVVKQGGQFVLLGSSPIPIIDEEFHALKRHYADHPHIGIALQHQELLAHLIYAGSDIFIVPSNFEPCGLTQLIALRYGTIPLVRETGGLKDTVFDGDHDVPDIEKACGYTFLNPTKEVFDQCIKRAMDCWRHHPDKWRKMVIEAMKHDFSWQRSAQEYLKRYQQIIPSSS